MSEMINWFGKGLTDIDKRFTNEDGVIDYKAIYEKHQNVKKWYDKENVGEFEPHKDGRGIRMFYFSTDTYRAACDAGWKAVLSMTEEDMNKRTQLSIFIEAMQTYMYRHCMAEDPFCDRPDAYQLVKIYSDDEEPQEPLKS